MNFILLKVLLCTILDISKSGILPSLVYPPVVWESFSKIIGSPFGGNCTVPRDTPEEISIFPYNWAWFPVLIIDQK